MRTRRGKAWLPLMLAIGLAGCGTFGGERVGTGQPPVCRNLNNQRAAAIASNDGRRVIEITEGLIRAGCERRPT